MLGALISLTIQACGGDKDEIVKTSSGGSTTSDDKTSEMCNCAWASQKIASQVVYDEDRQESSRTDYVYDNQGKLTGMKMMLYAKNSSGRRYLSWVQEIEYTYSDSNDIQYSTTKSIQYDEIGQITNTSKTFGKMILYKE